MDIESKLWRLRQLNGAYVELLQKASRTTKIISRGTFPSFEALAQMTERQFDKICREAFH